MVDKKVVSNKEVIYEVDEDEYPYGRFFLKDGEGEKIELVDFIWDEGIGERRNEAIADQLAKKYTTLFRLTDEEVRFNAADDAMSIASNIQGITEAFTDTKGTLAQNMGELSVAALASYTSSTLDCMYYDYFNDDGVEGSGTNPLNLTEEDVKEAGANGCVQSLLLIGGQAFNEAGNYAKEALVERYSSPDEIVNLIKERGPESFNKTDIISTIMY